MSKEITPPPETGAATKSGRGGKRPGAGRKPGQGPPGKKYGISLPGPEAARLDAAAQNEGIRPATWIVRAVRRALDAQGV